MDQCMKDQLWSDPAGKIPGIASALKESYADMVGVNRADGDNLPNRTEIIAITERLLDIIFPGFDGEVPYKRETLESNIPRQLQQLYDNLFSQILRAIRYYCKKTAPCSEFCIKNRANVAVLDLLEALPDIRRIMKKDVEAAYAGDPAATSFDEVILSYPGVKAITIQRLAHRLYCQEIPLIPRMMTEYAHSMTGIDIHPGSRLGEGVFIDHGTGVVIGETAILGNNVRIYQGVTLGAGNFPKDASGMIIKGLKRHPTIGNNVTIYSGASVLGDVTIGDNSVIGGNVWLMESLPAGTKITARPPEHTKKFYNDK